MSEQRATALKRKGPEVKVTYQPNSLFASSFAACVNSNQTEELRDFYDVLGHKEFVSVVRESKFGSYLDHFSTTNVIFYYPQYERLRKELLYCFPSPLEKIVYLDAPSYKKKCCRNLSELPEWK